jgi:predicted metal-dependent phosphoesterase TrpH
VARKVDPVLGAWRVDLHSHTYVSKDSMTDPRDLIERARAVGLAKLAVTDHNSIEGARECQALAPDLIIIGQEIDTSARGELIAYFVQEQIPRGLPPEEAIRLLRAQGAVISVSHPLDRFRNSAMGEEKTIAIIDQVDALEVFNSRCLLNADNKRAAELAARYKKLGTAGSDGHTLAEIGKGYVELPPFKGNAEAFLASLALGKAGGRITGVIPHWRSTLMKRAKKAKR